eukprot:COSAG03_NODE_5516_length_1230_cov_2.114943_1_plen_196_part_00
MSIATFFAVADIASDGYETDSSVGSLLPRLRRRTAHPTLSKVFGAFFPHFPEIRSASTRGIRREGACTNWSELFALLLWDVQYACSLLRGRPGGAPVAPRQPDHSSAPLWQAPLALSPAALSRSSSSGVHWRYGAPQDDRHRRRRTETQTDRQGDRQDSAGGPPALLLFSRPRSALVHGPERETQRPRARARTID